MGHEDYAYGMWIVVAFNVGLFLFFIMSFIKPTKRVEWRNMGVVTAFLVALFAEMYGFPLTIFMLTAWLGEAYPVLDPFTHKNGHLWVALLGGSSWVWVFVMALSLALLVAGYTLLSKGWRQIHAAKGQLVTDGVYAFVRHPQYSGLFLCTIAFIVQWPTLITVLMWPILIYAYTHLAYSEERSVSNIYGDDYVTYAERKPAFFPNMRSWKAYLSAEVPD